MILKSPTALSIPFNPTNGMVSDNVRDGIQEAYNQSAGVSKGYVFCQYNGNANSGRFLEFFSGISSDDAPLYSTTVLEIIEIVASTTAVDATCSIGFYNDTVLLYTVTFTGEKRVILSGSPVLTLPATGELKVKVDSGSISKPHIYFVARGA